MKTITKTILTFIFFIILFLTPISLHTVKAYNPIVTCGTTYYGVYCSTAKTNAENMTCYPGSYGSWYCDQGYDYGYYCPPPYPYPIWEYGWSCMRQTADCAGSAYPSCGGSCSSGSCGASEGKCSCSTTPSCSVTAPTGLAYTNISASSGNLTWTIGNNGTTQKLYGGDDKTKVDAGCPSGIGPGTGCVVKEETLSSSLNTFTTSDVLSSGTVYNWRIVNVGDCERGSAPYIALSSCFVSPTNMSLYPGESYTLTTSVNSSTGIGSVQYTPSTSGGSNFVNVNPAEDSSYPYGTTVTATSAIGSGTVTSSVENTSGNSICSSDANVIVMSPLSWWQVKDSDVFSNGSVISQIPSTATFGLSGLGGFPGVIGYGTTYNFRQGTVTSTNWLANTVSSSSRIYDYNYFARQLSQTAIDYLDLHPISSFSQATLSGSDGYTDPVSGLTFYKTASGGEILIDGNIDVGSNKVVLLAGESDVRISGTINVDDGTGLFVLFVGGIDQGRGNIYIEPTVGGAPGGLPQLEGIYLADGVIYTGSLGADLDSQLYIRGSMAGLLGVTFQRDMLDNTVSPSELFEYAPDQIMLLLNYPALSAKKMNWKEVAP